MRIKTILKEPGFRQFIIKTVIFIFLIFIIRISSHLIYRPTHLEFRHLSRVFLFVILIFILYNRFKLVKLKKYKLSIRDLIIFIPASILLFILQYPLEIFLETSKIPFSDYIKTVLYLSFIFALGIGVYGILFLRDLVKTYKKQIIPFALLAVFLFIIQKLFERIWFPLSRIVSKLLYFLFSLTFEDVKLTIDKAPLLTVDGFSASIGESCSGVDSLLLFITLFIFIWFLDFKKLNPKKMLIIFIPGLIGMFLFNVLRIYILFLVANYTSPEFAIGLFHTNIGWILFLGFFFIFWHFGSNYVYKK